MARYRTKSAEVLNEADRLGRILDWRLFCIAQEKILYGGDRWEPGDFLYRMPTEIRDSMEMDWEYFNEFPGEDDEHEFGPGFWGNCMRPIFQTYEFAEDELGEGAGTRYEQVENYPNVRCEPCGVGWGRLDGDACWMCGTEYPSKHKRPPLQKWAHRPHAGPQIIMGDVNLSADGMTFTGHLDFSGMANTIVTPEAVEHMRQSLLGISVGFDRVGQAAGRVVRSFSEMTDHLHFYVERDVLLTEQLMRRLWGGSDHYSIAPNQFSIEPYEMVTPPSNPLVREEREIVLVEPVVSDLPEMADVVPNLHIQPGWEADVLGWIDPRHIPQRRERDWSELQEEPYWVRIEERGRR